MRNANPCCLLRLYQVEWSVIHRHYTDSRINSNTFLFSESLTEWTRAGELMTTSNS